MLKQLKEKIEKVKGVKSLKKNKDSIAVDLSGDKIKIVHFQESDQKIQTRHVAVKIIPDDDARTAQFIEESLSKFETNTREVICLIPSKYLISRNIDMPSNNKEEIAKIINLQVGRFTPYSRDEIVIDYLCHEMVGQHYTNVLLVIVHRKVIDRYYRILDKAGLVASKIVIGSEALARTYPSMVTDLEVKTIGGVHVGENSSDFTVVEDGRMIFIRNIAVGYEELKNNGEGAVTELCGELGKSVAAYQEEGVGQPLEVLILTGIGKQVPELSEKIKTNVTSLQALKHDIRWSDYLRQYSLSEAAQAETSQFSEFSFFDLLASRAQHGNLTLDLIPREVRVKREIREGGRDIITLGILIMTVFLMLSFMLSLKIYFKGETLQNLDRVNEKTFDQARALERISTKTRAVRKLLENRGRGLYAFQKITALIGPEIYLTEFDYDSEGNIVIAGTADTMSRVFAFVTELEESNYFESVKTEETQSRRQGGKEVADFRIQCQLAEGFYK